jgi:hypothetical protein
MKGSMRRTRGKKKSKKVQRTAYNIDSDATRVQLSPALQALAAPATQHPQQGMKWKHNMGGRIGSLTWCRWLCDRLLSSFCCPPPTLRGLPLLFKILSYTLPIFSFFLFFEQVCEAVAEIGLVDSFISFSFTSRFLDLINKNS